MSLHPKNPVIDDNTGRPRERGKTKTLQDGSLEYLNELTGQWEPAVHLNTIRAQVIDACNSQGSYTKSGAETHNVTGFLPEDKDFGGAWDQRPPLLFQIMSTEDQDSREPAGYAMYDGRIVLDAFDHGIRHFPGQLPLPLSTELEGWRFEHYLRRNRQIKRYDLMARMPSNYTDSKGKVHNEPPRIFSLAERATKFREKAALPAIKNRAGSDKIKEYILRLLPQGATSIWSLGRDRTTEEVKALKAANKGTCPNKRRKEKRAADASATSQGGVSGGANAQSQPIHLDGGVRLDISRDNFGTTVQGNSAHEAPDAVNMDPSSSRHSATHLPPGEQTRRQDQARQQRMRDPPPICHPVPLQSLSHTPIAKFLGNNQATPSQGSLYPPQGNSTSLLFPQVNVPMDPPRPRKRSFNITSPPLEQMPGPSTTKRQRKDDAFEASRTVLTRDPGNVDEFQTPFNAPSPLPDVVAPPVFYHVTPIHGEKRNFDEEWSQRGETSEPQSLKRQKMTKTTEVKKVPMKKKPRKPPTSLWQKVQRPIAAGSAQSLAVAAQTDNLGQQLGRHVAHPSFDNRTVAGHPEFHKIGSLGAHPNDHISRGSHVTNEADEVYQKSQSAKSMCQEAIHQGLESNHPPIEVSHAAHQPVADRPIDVPNDISLDPGHPAVPQSPPDPPLIDSGRRVYTDIGQRYCSDLLQSPLHVPRPPNVYQSIPGVEDSGSNQRHLHGGYSAPDPHHHQGFPAIDEYHMGSSQRNPINGLSYPGLSANGTDGTSVDQAGIDLGFPANVEKDPKRSHGPPQRGGGAHMGFLGPTNSHTISRSSYDGLGNYKGEANVSQGDPENSISASRYWKNLQEGYHSQNEPQPAPTALLEDDTIGGTALADSENEHGVNLNQPEPSADSLQPTGQQQHHDPYAESEPSVDFSDEYLPYHYNYPTGSETGGLINQQGLDTGGVAPQHPQQPQNSNLPYRHDDLDFSDTLVEDTIDTGQPAPNDPDVFYYNGQPCRSATALLRDWSAANTAKGDLANPFQVIPDLDWDTEEPF